VLALTLSVALPTPARGAEVYSPAELVPQAVTLDGTMVTMAGEAIGDRMRGDEPDHQWINLLGAGTAVGVYMPSALADQVSVYGDYDHMGDVVEVRGIFNAACDQHGGDLDVHAESLVLLTAGRVRAHETRSWEGIVGGACLVLAFALTRVYRQRRLSIGESV
jgi:hypothetical protein